MISRLRRFFAVLLIAVLLVPPVPASVHNQKPKLVVLIVIDQFRGDYLERFRDQFGPGGFRFLMDRGAWFTECYYDYANLHTAPGHATLGTGAYSNGHGIFANDWYDPYRKGVFSSVADGDHPAVGIPGNKIGASPRNLLATTFGDEVKLATQGKSRVFGISLKDRSAILPAGLAADAAYWIDKDSGAWITSTYYRPDGTLPAWAKQFNDDNRAAKYLDREVKDAAGKVLRSTAPGQKEIDGTPLDYYETVGRTPFGNDYTLEFARELVQNEKLGSGPTTDVLTLSISPFDVLGHKVGPDSPEQAVMLLTLDRQLADFFGFLGRQVGLANVWIALSADHGMAPMPEVAQSMHLPVSRWLITDLMKDLNQDLSKRFSPAKETEFVKAIYWPALSLNPEAFRATGLNEAEAEHLVAEMVMAKYAAHAAAAGEPPSVQHSMRGYYTRSQLEAGLPNAAADDLARKYVHSYSPQGGWYVLMEPRLFLIVASKTRWAGDDDHGAPYSYDTHVPLIFFGLPFQPGMYRTHAEPVDLAVTLTSLLGVNKPSRAVGRVLTEALAAPSARNSPPPETSKGTAKPAEKPE